MKQDLAKEDLRQAVHLLVGVAAVLLVQHVGFNSALLFMSVIFIGGLLLANYKMLGGQVKLIDQLVELTDRNVPIPGQGAMYFAVAIIFLLTFSRPVEFGLAIVLLHAAGDAFATIVGLRWKLPLPWNRGKTWTGLAAFLVFGALAAQFFIPFQRAALYAFTLAIVESMPLPVDDNVTTPLAAVILSMGGLL